MEINNQANKNIANLVEFPTNIPYNNIGFPTPMPLCKNAFLLFRVQDKPNRIKPLIQVNFDKFHNRYPDKEVSYLEIDNNGLVAKQSTSLVTNPTYFFYPFNSTNQIELYDIYVVPKRNLSEFDINQIDNYNPLAQGNSYLYKFTGEPASWFATFNENQSDIIPANLIPDGQFNDAYISLPADSILVNNVITSIPEGTIRSRSTPIAENVTYEVNYSGNFDQSLYGDILSIETFTSPATLGEGTALLEGSPNKYFRVQAKNKDNSKLWTYRDIAFLFKPFHKFNGRDFILSFAAKNNNPDEAPLMPINIGYERFYGAEADVEGRAVFPNITPFMLGATWQKYFVQLNLLPSQTIVQDGEDTYVKILLRLPVSLSIGEFDISITNCFIDYGTEEVGYPLIAESTIEHTADNNIRPIVTSSTGNIALSSHAGEIRQFIFDQDTETTMLADGRVIYPDDVHYYPSDGTIFVIPFSNSFGTGLYDRIGYRYGTGLDHFTCDSLHNPAWIGDIGVFNNMFSWNYAKFKPTSDFTTGMTKPLVMKITELHRGQDIPSDLQMKAFYEKDDSFIIRYSNNQENYINTAEENEADVSEFRTTDNIGFSVNGTLPSVNSIQYFSNTVLTSSEDGGSVYFPSRMSPLVSTDPVNINTNVNFPIKKIDRFNYGGNYGSIDINLVDTTETPPFVIDSDYYNTKAGQFAQISNGLTLIAKFADNFRALESSHNILDYMPHTYAIVKIKSNNGALPVVNEDFTIQPLQDSVIANADVNIIQTTIINTYYQDPINNWLATQGQNNAVKKIVLKMASQGRSAFGMKLLSGTAVDYSGLWFYAESDAKRTLVTKTYVDGVESLITSIVPDNKFCFYFQTGSDVKPTSGTISPDAKFIEIKISGLSTIEAISKAIEKTINSYRVQIPDFRGMTLKGYGKSMFDTENNSDKTLCDNFRNDGFAYPKEIQYSKNFVGSGVGSNTSYYAVQESVKNPFDLGYVYNHISVN